MNKKNKILVGCLALLLALSVGYALFSDTITINGTATAKGDFNITPECISGTVIESDSFNFKEHGYSNEICTADDESDTVSFNTNLLYPGATRAFTVKMTNTGTINSMLPEEIPIDGEASKVCDASDNMDADPETEGTCKSYSHYSANLLLYAIQVGNGPIYDVLGGSVPEEVLLEFSENDKVFLKPGNSAYYISVLKLSENYGNQMNVFMKYVYNPVFEQATN